MTQNERDITKLAETKIRERRRRNIPLSTAESPPSLMREIGATGTSIWSGIITEEYQVDLKGSLKYKVFQKMRNDAQVMATLLVIELPIRAGEWAIKPAEENSVKSDEIAAFVHDALLKPGAMSITWDDFIRQSLLMLTYGFMLFEICYKLEGGKLLWQKFAPRMPASVYRWLTDATGGYAGFEQWGLGDRAMHVTIPAEKTLRFTHRQEGSNFEGVSFLRWIYKNWWYKDLLYRLAGMAAERTGVGTPAVTLPQGYSSNDGEIARKIVESYRANEEAGIVFPPGYEFEIKQGGPFQYLMLIEHHDRQIAKGILAQFLNLGQEKVGSYSLAETQWEMFSMSLGAITQYICDIINVYAIPRLVQLNFDSDAYPILYCTLPKSMKAIIDAAKILTESSLLSPDPKLEEYMRKMMDLPPMPKDSKGLALSPLRKQQPKQETTTAHEQIQLAMPGKDWQPDPFWRAPNRWEDKKHLKQLNDNWNQLEFDFQRGVEGILDKQRDDLVRQVEIALEKASFRQLLNIAPRYGEELRQFIKAAFLEAVDFSRKNIAADMDLKAQEISAKINQWINARAELTAMRTQEDMRWEVTRKIFNRKDLLSEIADGAVGSQTIKKIAREAFEAVQDYKSRNLTILGRAVIGEGIRTGRDTIANHPEVSLAMRSEILDGKTCENCIQLDGYTTPVDSDNYARYSPPQHCVGGNNCRGVWIYIKKDETPQPEIIKEQPRLEPTAF